MAVNKQHTAHCRDGLWAAKDYKPNELWLISGERYEVKKKLAESE